MLLYFIIIEIIPAINRDVNTFSIYYDLKIKSLHPEGLLDFEMRCINATTEYNFDVTNVVKEIYLGIHHNSVIAIYYTKSGTVFNFEIENMKDQSVKQGDRLKIQVQQFYKRRVTQVFLLKQTESKEQIISMMKFFHICIPFAKIINADQAYPEDPPSIKQYFSELVFVRNQKITVFMTANILFQKQFKKMNNQNGELTEYHF